MVGESSAADAKDNKTDNVVIGDDKKRKMTPADLDRLAKRRKVANARRRKLRRQQRFYSGDSEDEKLKTRLLKKTGKSGNKKRNDRNGEKVVDIPLIREIPTSKSSKKKINNAAESARQFEILNPDSYKRLVSRFEENQINKAPRPSSGDFMESAWICALCQQPPTVQSLGDLFGPYYCRIYAEGAFWPPYLKPLKATKKSTAHETFTDFWFHGYCALWASGILAKGNMLIGLDEHLPDYWKQKCARCQIVGASIGCKVKGCKKIYHFVCAVQADCKLQEENLTMCCDAHKKSHAATQD